MKKTIVPVSALATPEEAAEYLRSTAVKLANDRYRGIGPKFVKHGRRVLYRWSDLEDYVNSNVMTRTDDRPGAA
ncbi:helix-turn-helix domain-containing protein [Rhodococcus artemisiae]|uniref:Helix-turn-helix domain-containing protein n=1 Tax=Rhodococcus artemisiae TaxID=714159 RepID=A0ABU7L9N5_9NOCA|nr:helix-turn-helix domain-containing protein [Rhodococcus artemisiae]MEE2058262.1 helix-turn-helix domain-containing protein [Rhodococcus artemisiae]